MIGQFTMKLRSSLKRPVVSIPNFFNITAMIDTGALIPVWVKDEAILQACGAKFLFGNAGFSGFGGETSGNVYQIQNFTFGNLLFPTFHIVTSKINIPAQMILPATMFDGLVYEFDTDNHAMNITIPDTQSKVRNLVLERKDGRMIVLCNNVNEK